MSPRKRLQPPYLRQRNKKSQLPEPQKFKREKSSWIHSILHWISIGKFILKIVFGAVDLQFETYIPRPRIGAEKEEQVKVLLTEYNIWFWN